MSRPFPNDEAVFTDALAQPRTERTAFLDQACQNDPAMRARLAALLAAHEQSDEVFDPPVLRSSLLSNERPGAMVGRYMLVEKIGEGGCGVVYLAEQQAPVHRRVALKVIKLGMDTQDVIVRFEAERQALAMMDHPNIAKVFDAGATEAGRPYFVMELVAGTRITTYCDQRNLPTTERLKLFAQVCHAVQHAHQKGIIHRDIKPSNILVAEHDGVPVPKVIDFGIAKATHGRLTDRTVLTAIAQFIGTPVYMSPEQAELKSVDIDTRSDIYSLGVLLYELVAGRPPFDPQTLASAGLDEIRRHIREIEPPRPSTRLATLSDDDRAAIADLRGTDPGRLTIQLRGDLDWIVMRCLEKDRSRRYETANGLAADIHRHLEDQPVSATPPSAAYRFKKLVWRHKFAFASGGAIAALLIAGSIVSMWQAVRAMRAERLAETRLGSELVARQEAEKQRREAETQRKLALERMQAADESRQEAESQRTLAEQRLRSETAAREESERQKSLAEQERQRALVAEKAAQAEAEISKAVNEFLQEDLLRQADSRVQAVGGAAPSADLKMRDALDRAAERAEGRFGNRPLIEAGIRTVIGNTYVSLGEPAKAATQLERALALRKVELGPTDKGTIVLMHQLSYAYRAGGRLAEAIAVDEEALEISRRRQDDDVSLLMASTTNLAAAYRAQGRLTEALPLTEQVLELARRHFGAGDLHTLRAMNNLAVINHTIGRLEEAARLYFETIEALTKVFGAEHPETLKVMSNLAETRIALGQLANAVGALAEVYVISKRLFGTDHPDTLEAMAALAAAHREAGNVTEARALFDELVTLRRRVLGPEHPDTLKAMAHVAATNWAAGHRDEAIDLLDQTAKTQSRVLGAEHPETIRTLSGVACMLRDQGRYEDAGKLFRRTLEARHRLLGPRHLSTYESARNLGGLYVRQRRFAEAEELLVARCYQDLTTAEISGLTGPEREVELERLMEMITGLHYESGDTARGEEWYERLNQLDSRRRRLAARAAAMELSREAASMRMREDSATRHPAPGNSTSSWAPTTQSSSSASQQQRIYSNTPTSTRSNSTRVVPPPPTPSSPPASSGNLAGGDPRPPSNSGGTPSSSHGGWRRSGGDGSTGSSGASRWAGRSSGTGSSGGSSSWAGRASGSTGTDSSGGSRGSSGWAGRSSGTGSGGGSSSWAGRPSGSNPPSSSAGSSGTSSSSSPPSSTHSYSVNPTTTTAAP